MKRIFILIFVCIISFGASGCQKIVPQSPQITVEGDKPIVGGAITIGSVEPSTLNPLLANSVTYGETAKLIFDPLVDYDDKLQLTPILAESWTCIDGSSQYQIKLRSNILWSDGQPITANDVKFSLDTIKNAAASTYKSNIEHIYSYQVVDDKNIKIVFDQSYANAMDSFTFPIIPEHVYSMDINAIPVGSGPYKIAQYNKLKNIELVQNENWSQMQNGTNQKPLIDKITVFFINDLDAFSTSFQSRQIDILNTSYYDWEKYKEMNDVNTYPYISLNYDFIGFNFNNPIFQDKAVRKAIIQGINRKDIVDKNLLGHAAITDTPIYPDSWLNDGKGIQYIYSKINAQNELSKAGFADNDKDNILDRDVSGVKQILKFTLLTNSENEFRKNAADAIKKNLEEIGFSVEIKLVPFAEMKAALAAKQFDAVLTGYNLSPNQDLSFAFHSTQIASGNNFSSYSNPDLDNLLQLAYMTTDNNIRKDLYQKIQSSLREEVPCVSLFFRESAIVARNKVGGQIKPDVVNPFRDIEKWYVSAKAK